MGGVETYLRLINQKIQWKFCILLLIVLNCNSGSNPPGYGRFPTTTPHWTINYWVRFSWFLGRQSESRTAAFWQRDPIFTTTSLTMWFKYSLWSSQKWSWYFVRLSPFSEQLWFVTLNSMIARTFLLCSKRTPSVSLVWRSLTMENLLFQQSLPYSFSITVYLSQGA